MPTQNLLRLLLLLMLMLRIMLATVCHRFRAMKLQHLYSAHEGAATSLSFHPSGNFLASGAGDSKVEFKVLDALASLDFKL